MGKALFLALLIVVGFFVVADIIAKYTIYFGPFPIAYPYAFTGWTPQQIAEATGMSYAWVMKYLPDEFKDEEKAHTCRRLS